MSDLIPCQRMVFVFLRERFAACQLTDNVVKKINIQMALHGQLVVLFELGSPGDIQMLAYSFEALNASSTSE